MKSKNLAFLSLFLLILSFFNSFAISSHNDNSNTDNEKDINANSTTQTVSVNKYYLPGTNISVNSYIIHQDDTISKQESFNVSVLSINSTQWYAQFDYTTNVSNSIFFSYIDRFSKPNSYFYKAKDYINVDNNPSTDFDFWIDSNKLHFDPNITITNTTFDLAGIGQFDAYKVDGIIPEFGTPYSAWYERTSGLFLSFNFIFVDSIWYNLTMIELPTFPQNYKGPYLVSSSPEENEQKPGGTLIDLRFGSLYGIQDIYYHWDNGFITHKSNIAKIATFYPNNNGNHTLNVTLTGKIGFNASHNFYYYTNNSLLGVNLINLNNNSKIKGNTIIEFQIISGNGTFTYNWDGALNSTVNDGTPVNIPNPLIERQVILSIYVKGENTTEWINKKYIFQIDNTPPVLSITNMKNGTTLKGTVSIELLSNEDSILNYNINNLKNTSLVLEQSKSQSVSFFNLKNGSYIVNFFLQDEANNSNTFIFIFSIYTSSFGWIWDLHKNEPKSIPFLDVSGNLMFTLTITSKIDQNFSIVRQFDNSSLNLNQNIEILFKFLPQKSEQILYLEFFLPMALPSNNKLPIYQWKYWDEPNGDWQTITTSYNDINYGWEGTASGNRTIFALVLTTETTIIERGIPTGGGSLVPGFSLEIILLSFMFIFIYYRKKLKIK